MHVLLEHAMECLEVAPGTCRPGRCTLVDFRRGGGSAQHGKSTTTRRNGKEHWIIALRSRQRCTFLASQPEEIFGRESVAEPICELAQVL